MESRSNDGKVRKRSEDHKDIERKKIKVKRDLLSVGRKEEKALIKATALLKHGDLIKAKKKQKLKRYEIDKYIKGPTLCVTFICLLACLFFL